MSGAASLLALTSLPQKLLMGGLGAALFATGTYNVVQSIENRHLAAANAKLDTRINDPKTGYVVKLTQAETNGTICTAAVARQSDAIKAQGAKDAATLAATQARYDIEHAARIRAEASAAVILSHKPQGATVTDRVADVDAQILGDLK